MNGHTLMIAGLALTGLGLVSMAFPRMRRVFRAVCTFTFAHIPRWFAFILAPVLAACQRSPGGLDELGRHRAGSRAGTHARSEPARARRFG